MDFERKDYLLLIEKELYTIKIHKREEGYNLCYYKIVTDDEYKLCESSTRKIFLRILNTFVLHRDKLSDIQLKEIISDLQLISEKLKIPETFSKEKIIGILELNN